MSTAPVTPADLDRYTRRARARVFWGHRKSGIVESLERKGVQRLQAKHIVAGAVSEHSGLMLREAAVNLGAAALATLVALLFHSPGIVTGKGMNPVHLEDLSLTVLPFLCVAMVFLARALLRLLRAALPA